MSLTEYMSKPATDSFPTYASGTAALSVTLLHFSNFMALKLILSTTVSQSLKRQAVKHCSFFESISIQEV